MHKNKTHKGLRKRVKITANGNIKHSRSGGGHLMSSKSAKRRRKISTRATLKPSTAKVLKSQIS